MNGRLRICNLTTPVFGAALACATILLGAGTSLARPTYFEQFKSLYSIGDGDNLDACGVCHFRWLGTGARNPYGTTVEQRLYLGKTIIEALTEVEGMDPDGDGFTSVDEIVNFMTLPGYNCENYVDASGAPTGYDAYITPGVASCLEPLDIRTTPTSLGTLINVGSIKVMELTVLNNGSTDPLNITSYGFLAVPPADLQLSGPTAPFSIPVGESVTIQATFTPTTSLSYSSHLRISSNDPDEADLDIPISVTSLPDPTAPGDQRGPCFEAITKAATRYAKAQLRQWSTCYLEELAGRACDTGARDLKLARAAAKLAAAVGGDKDKSCEAAGLNAITLGFPASCSEGCEDITLASVGDIATCLVCVQDRVMEGVLRDGIGTAPPDLPPNVIASDEATACQEDTLRTMQKGLLKMYGELSECELAAVLAEEAGGTCQTDLATELADLRASIGASVDRCTDTTDLLGCPFETMSPDTTCLGLSAEELAVRLTNSSFGLYEP